jgi:hypothetical protein
MRTLHRESFRASERFLERPQVEFLRPGRTLLAMDVPIGFSEFVDAE